MERIKNQEQTLVIVWMFCRSIHAYAGIIVLAIYGSYNQSGMAVAYKFNIGAMTL